MFVAYVSDDGYSAPRILSVEHWPAEHDVAVWQAMWLKKPGELGMADEKYFNAPGVDYPYLGKYTDKDVQAYEKAKQAYVTMAAIERSDSRYGSLDADDLFYCKAAHYFAGGKFRTLRKCD